MSDVDRTIGVLAALDYLGLDFGHTPVIGRTTDKFPKRRPRHWASLATAVKMRYLKPKHKQHMSTENTDAAAAAPTRQLAKPQATLKDLISGDKFREQVSLALPAHLTPERFSRIALNALQRTPKLQDCTQASLFKCLLDMAAMGIEPDGRRAHLIPYGNEVTLILDYKGLLELVRRSGDVVSIRSELVCENDEFSWENGKVTHKIDWRKPRGEMQAVYAEAVLKSGETQTATMTKDEVDAIRKRSRGGNNGPWATDYGEMAKKTSLRRLCKLLPLSPEIAEHVDKDQDIRTEIDITPKASAALNLPSQQEVAP